MKKIFVVLTLIVALPAVGQKLTKIEPASWWRGMELDTVEFMVYGKDISELTAVGKELMVLGSTALESPNYLFVEVVISDDTRNGTHKLLFKDQKGRHKGTLAIEVLEREEGSAKRKGFTSADFIYLITPDRFRNGDPSNDQVKGMLEGPNREFIGGRHGGDLAGIIESLDYFEKMGISSLWLNPVLENNMETYSYHGYAMTD